MAGLRNKTTSGLVSSWSWAAKGKSKALQVPSNWLRSVSTSVNVQQLATQAASSPNASASASTPTAFAKDSNSLNTPITSTPSALALLKSQPSHYIVASLVGKTFTLSPRDVFTIPRLRDVEVGDVLELERIHEVGSRDYTLRAQDPMSTRRSGPVAAMRRAVGQGPDSRLAASIASTAPQQSSTTGEVESPLRESKSWATRLHPSGLAHVGAVLPSSTVRARAVVVEHTKGALETIVKKKRRKGYKKTIKHKQTYTRVRLEDIKLGEEQS
ncbi:unnamed protein product [Sympodiomycopsis kandeliae]